MICRNSRNIRQPGKLDLSNAKPHTSSHSGNNKEPSETQFQQLVDLYNRGEFLAAEAEVANILALFPKSASLLNLLGAIHKSSGQLPRAIEAYKKAVEVNPNYSEAYNNLALVYMDCNDAEKAVESIKKALEVAPHQAEAIYNLGNIYFKTGKYEMAAQAYHSVLRLRPDFANAHHNVGIIFMREKKYEYAIESFSEAVKLNPENAQFSNHLGVAFLKAGLIDDAIFTLKNTLKLSPGSSYAHNNLANSLYEKGKIAEGFNHYKKALVIDPNSLEFIENLHSLYIQSLSIAELNHRDKVSEIQKYTSIDTPKLIVQRGIIDFLFARFDKSRLSMKKFSLLKPNDLESLSYKNKVFCEAYNGFVSKLLEEGIDSVSQKSPVNPIIHIGESHCLSYAHRTVNMGGELRQIKPAIVFGAKAYHFTKTGRNRYKEITRQILNNLPTAKTIFISFGEIDCRPNEGFISASQKSTRSIADVVETTVKAYVRWFYEQNKGNEHKLYFLNVPAPVYDPSLCPELNTKVANTVSLFNTMLSDYVESYGFNLIDVYHFTNQDNGFSNKIYHIDKRHLGPKALPKIEMQFN